MNLSFFSRTCPIKGIIVSEKSYALRAAHNQLVIKCGLTANKNEILNWFEKIFETKPIKISIMRCDGKTVSNRKSKGKHPDYKKAIISFGRDVDIEKMISFKKS